MYKQPVGSFLMGNQFVKALLLLDTVYGDVKFYMQHLVYAQSAFKDLRLDFKVNFVPYA